LNGELLIAGLYTGSRKEILEKLNKEAVRRTANMIGTSSELLTYLFYDGNIGHFEDCVGEDGLAMEIVDQVKQRQAKMYVTEKDWSRAVQVAQLCTNGYSLVEALQEIRAKELGKESISALFANKTIQRWEDIGICGETNIAVHGLTNTGYESRQMEPRLMWALVKIAEK
jgi:hypothetical protein